MDQTHSELEKSTPPALHFFIQVALDGSLIFANTDFRSNFIDNKETSLSFQQTIHRSNASQWSDISETLLSGKDTSVKRIILHQDRKNQTVEIEWSFYLQNNESDSFIEGFGNVQTNLQSPESKSQEMYDWEKIMDSSLDVICCFDRHGKFLKVSAACYSIWGYQPDELIGKSYIDLIYEEDISRTKKATFLVMEGRQMHNFENRNYTKDGGLVTLIWSSKWDNNEKKFYSIARNATEIKESEKALKTSEEKYKLLFYKHPLPMWIYDVDTYKFIEVNESAVRHYGYSRDEFLNMTLKEIRPKSEWEKLMKLHENNNQKFAMHNDYWLHQKKNGEIIQVEITANGFVHEGRQTKLVIAFDRTDQVKAEEELARINERYHFVSQATFDAIWDSDLENKTIVWNEGFKNMFGYKKMKEPEKLIWWEEHLHAEDKERVINKLNKTIASLQNNWEDEYRFRCENGSYKYVLDRGFIVYNEKQEPSRLIGAVQDLTERKAYEILLKDLNSSLEKRASELAASNQELERFAYVASHDLQEPLRMVTSFLELLQKKYKEKLDQKAHEYIHFAVDGAERMKELILDLLEYSRVNTSKEERKIVDINHVLKNVQLTYKQLLHDTNGSIVAGELPKVLGNQTQIIQLFQNIIGNALKYRSTQPPQIKIDYKLNGNFFEFAITDNGIGIDPRFFHKIFIIFQRLHNRVNYTGTGIGLAICKKITERHGGKIWVSSEPNVGSTFYFTLPRVN